MRAGPLSDASVIEILNQYYVPVYISNEDYVEDGSASQEEKEERLRIFDEGRAAGLSVGTVHAYILSPGGRTVDSLHVAQAARTPELLAMLRRNAEQFAVKAGPPVLPPRRQSQPPQVDRNGLLLHLTARVIEGGAWGDIPGENWIALKPEEARTLLPDETDVSIRSRWDVPPETAARVLVHFYPATENNEIEKNKIQHLALQATVLHREGGIARAKLEGRLEMLHDFYHRADGLKVQTDLIGYLDFDPATKAIKQLHLVTQDAQYNGGRFGIALQMRPQ